MRQYAGRRQPFWVVAAALFILTLGTNLPTPLYTLYEKRFGFSNTVLTLLFATYAIVLMPSLLAFGQLSDSLGRRPLLALGLSLAAVALMLFAFAHGAGWLFAARALQGVAVGMTSGTGAAVLVELEPRGDRARAALFSTVAQSAGAAVGPLLSGSLAEWAPAPRLLSYLVALPVVALAAAAVLFIPEPGAHGRPWRPRLPHVPAQAHTRFVRAAVTGTLVSATSALFISVLPTYADEVVKVRNLALLGALDGLMLSTACAVQLLVLRTRLNSMAGQITGLLLIVIVAILATALPVHAIALLIASVLTGASLGIGFVAAQTEVNRLAPADRRGELTAAFLTCTYAGNSVAAVSAGVLLDRLPLFTTVTIVAGAIAAIALVAPALLLRHRSA